MTLKFTLELWDNNNIDGDKQDTFKNKFTIDGEVTDKVQGKCHVEDISAAFGRDNENVGFVLLTIHIADEANNKIIWRVVHNYSMYMAYSWICEDPILKEGVLVISEEEYK